MREFIRLLKENFWFCAIIFALCIFNLIWFNVITFSSRSIFWVVQKSFKGIAFSLLFEIIILHLGYCVLHFMRVKNLELAFRRFLLGVCIFCMIVCFIDSFLLLEYKTTFNAIVASVIIGTNLRESLEFFQSYFNSIQISIPVLLLFVLCFIAFLVFKFLNKNNYIFSKNLSFNRVSYEREREREREQTPRRDLDNFCQADISCQIEQFTCHSERSEESQKINYSKDSIESKSTDSIKNTNKNFTISKYIIIIFSTIYFALFISTISSFAVNYFKKQMPFYLAISRFYDCALSRIPFAFFAYFQTSQNLETLLQKHKIILQNLQSQIKTNNENLDSIESKTNIPKNIILIVGESSSRSFWGLYDFALPTTPMASALEKQGNLIKFTDIITPFGSTIYATRKILSFSPYEAAQSGEWSEYPNIFSLFGSFNFELEFFTNQELDSTSIMYFLYNLADVKNSAVKFAVFADMANYSTNYDENLLPFLNAKSNKNRLTLLHFIGSHMNYKNRYPSEFEKFFADDILRAFQKLGDARLNLEQKKLQMLAYYANSVLYSDYVLGEIYEIYKNEDALIIYTSDHGQGLYTDGIGAFHSFRANTSAEIPLIFIATEAFKKEHKNLYEELENAANLPFSTEDLPHLLCYLAQINHPLCNSTKNPLSSDFSPKERLFNGINYDLELKKQE